MKIIFLTLVIFVPFFLLAQASTEKKADLNRNLDLNKHKEQKKKTTNVFKQEVKTHKLDSTLIQDKREPMSRTEPKKLKK